MTRITQKLTTYQVLIRYREPSYELHAGTKSKPYSWTFTVTAPSAGEATKQAREEFKRAFQESHVGWVREIVSVEVIDP